MLNTTNLDYFAAHHQAEIFRLKAMFMAEPGMNDLDGANSALSTALSLWRQCPDAWLSWGQLCDARYEADPSVRLPALLRISSALLLHTSSALLHTPSSCYRSGLVYSANASEPATLP
jgi:hypothetical protein